MNENIVHIEIPGVGETLMIKIERTEEVLAAARELGDFINSLDLPTEQHNRLVALAIEQVRAAERAAYTQGAKLGMDYGRFEAGHSGAASD